MSQRTVVIAFGGISPEHEVSVLTAMQAFSALADLPWLLKPLYISKSGSWFTGDSLKTLDHYEDLDQLLSRSIPCFMTTGQHGEPVLRESGGGFFKKTVDTPVDVMLIAFHGSSGEDGSFQGLCEMYNIPYTGCDVLSSSLGMNKQLAKKLCHSHGIPVVPDHSFSESEWVEDSEAVCRELETLGYPLVVKPIHLGSSIGVSKVHDRETLLAAIEQAFRYDEHLLVEQAVQPLMEINCSVLGDEKSCRASVCERPVGEKELLSFADKYQSDSGESKGMASAARVIPADIPDSLTKEIQDASRKIFTLFGAFGVARLDFLVKADTHEFYFNEINTIPGSFSFYLWEESGLGFQALLEELIRQATGRHRKKNGRIQSYETNLLNQKAAQGLKGLKGIKGKSSNR